MKKIVSVLCGMLLMVSAAGCSAGGTESGVTESQSTVQESSAAPSGSSESEAPAASLSGKVSTNGSTSMEKVIGALSEAFMIQNPDVDVTYDPTGSGTGITAATDGTTDVGLSSRALKDTETGLTATTVALDGIAVIVHKNNPVKDLTIDQIAKLATGEISNWKDVGGNDAPVVLIGREAGSGTRDGFESIVGVSEKCQYQQELTATGAVIAAVVSNENAIGYASLSAVEDTVGVLNVEGVAPSEATVLDGSYKIQRPFVMVTKEGEALRPEVQAFLDFALDPAQAEIIANAGAVPASSK